ncbi:MAG: pyridoxamine 5'-phosphate oxidase family protein [Pseudanabaenaceae cyanobacterium bins.68]|nr:pyridoxamine 5'-phosphate oxidase family protein [Pseudanabaenaceae cyanobacterium bins.68]
MPYLAPWRSPLARNLYQHRNQPQARYLQLATTDLEGKPSNRTIVFRGFVDHLPNSSNLLKFISDRRAAKISHIQHQPWVEACWYFPKTREQFRISGKMLLVEAEHPNWSPMRQTTWQELSDQSRTQFSWSDPGQPLAQAPEHNQPPPSQAHPNFTLLLLDPWLVDRLELRHYPHHRSRYQKSGEQPQPSLWHHHYLNP